MKNEIKELRRDLQREMLDNKYLSEMLQMAVKNGLAEHKYEDIPISSIGHTIRCCKVCGNVQEEDES